MASIKLSAIVSAARGKVGGNVFSANKAGAFVRTYVKPTNRNTIAQQYVRNLFGTLSSSWRNLTVERRRQWTNMAVQYPYMNRLGDMATYTGQQLFNKLQGNINACINALPIEGSVPPSLIDTPATPQQFYPLFNGVENMDISSQSINLTFLLIDGLQFVPDGFGLILEATAPLSAGIESPQKGLFKSIGFIEANADLSDSTFSNGLYNSYVDTFGLPLAGSKYYFQVKQISYISGEATVAQRSLVTVTA